MLAIARDLNRLAPHSGHQASIDHQQPVLDAGAGLQRERDDEIDWDICTDPEGNEFCVFLPAPAEGEGAA